jgi:flagellar FliL protein
MADEEKKEEVKEEKSEEKDGSGGGNKVILIIIVILLLLLLVIGGAVAYFLLAGDEENPEDAQQKQDGKKIEKKEEKPKKDIESLEIGPIYPLAPFTVNLKSSGATRYLKCTLNLEIDTPETQPELDKMKPLLRDIVIRILSSKTVPEISTAKGKEKLKEEITKNLNNRLATGEIRNVYFTAFVIQ